MNPRNILSQWLFNNLAGTFIEGSTLYVGAAEVAMGEIDLSSYGIVEGNTLNTGFSIANGQVYPISTKKDIKGPYVVYDNLEVLYDSTKDGTFPSGLSARVLCVDKGYNAVEALADAVERKLLNAYIVELDADVELKSRRIDFDPNTGEYLEELRISLTI